MISEGWSTEVDSEALWCIVMTSLQRTLPHEMERQGSCNGLVCYGEMSVLIEMRHPRKQNLGLYLKHQIVFLIEAAAGG